MLKRIIILMLFSVTSYAMSFNQAQAVYNKLVSSNGFSVAPRLVLDPSSEVNASCSVLRITVNAGMLRFVHNSSELAMILGHELAHFSLHHRGSTPNNEYAADSLGARYASAGGYNRCSGAEVYDRFNDGPSTTHPDSHSRYIRLKC